jgi:anti-anti-sigma factor
MHINCFHKNEWTVVQIFGVIDSFTYPFLAREINILLRSGVHHLCLDFENNTYLNTAAYKFFKKTISSIAQKGGQVLLLKPQEEVRELLELMCFDVWEKSVVVEGEYK